MEIRLGLNLNLVSGLGMRKKRKRGGDGADGKSEMVRWTTTTRLRSFVVEEALE